jgi:hypothetical protein
MENIGMQNLGIMEGWKAGIMGINQEITFL